jgi:hypothetical protein
MMMRTGIFRNLLSLGFVGALLGACASMDSTGGSSEATTPGLYRLGDAQFQFADNALLQTWPDISMRPTLGFARLAVQMPADQLVPDLAGIQDAVQIDVLQAQYIPEPDAVVTGVFSDWKGRETAPAQSTYKFVITSQRGATGQQVAYLRQAQKSIGLDSLAPFKPQAGAPIYLVKLDDAHVTTLIECAPLPAGYHGKDHCSLRRKLDDSYGYRVLFPLDLLSYWEAFDDAARDYVNAAAQ